MSERWSRASFEVSAGGRGDVVVHLAGEIDAAVTPVFRDRLDEVVGTTDHDLMVDVAAVTFMDSSGLAVLVQARQQCQRSGRELLLVHPSPPVIRLLEVAGLDGWFGLREPPAEAATP